MRKMLDVKIGDEYGDYVCVDVIKKKVSKGNSNFYIMKCKVCGLTKEMLSSTIRLGKGIMHRSCGKGLKTLDKTFYSRWQAMRTRTTNENYAHADCYSSRGISSEEFANFIDFYDAMYPSYKELSQHIEPSKISLERIDTNGDYTVENCRWVDISSQQGNTRKNIMFVVTYPEGMNETCINLLGFCKAHNLCYNTIHDNLSEIGSKCAYKGFQFERIENLYNKV